MDGGSDTDSWPGLPLPPRPPPSLAPRGREAAEQGFRVFWDEVAPRSGGIWPASPGTLLFLWPCPYGDQEWPEWSRVERQDATWFNDGDRRVEADLLLPFYADLVASLEDRLGCATPFGVLAR